ncbi:hypothetical protein AURDEDRAFT_166966 [Auricularia subglabra TFB-10046 SS5]|nr:hypothetical protein AURDEDRAFT_166966 [Auricularia subglabra TFB-10046 SS5]
MAFNKSRETRATDWRPLRCLVLDQRAGLESWGEKRTVATFRWTPEREIEELALVRPLVHTVRLIRDSLYERRLILPNLDAGPSSRPLANGPFSNPPVRLALFVQAGKTHCVLTCSQPRRVRYLLDISLAELSSLEISWEHITDLTLALHMPDFAVRSVLGSNACNIKTLTLWANGEGGRLESLLNSRHRRLRLGPALREVQLTATCPSLSMPALCCKYIRQDLQLVPSSVDAGELAGFVRLHTLGNTAKIDLRVGGGVVLTGGPTAMERLRSLVNLTDNSE